MTVRVFQLKAPAEARSLATLRSFVTAALADRPVAFVEAVVLAVDEACANVVRHRRPGLARRGIDLTVELVDDRLRCRIGSYCAADDLPRIVAAAGDRLALGGRGTGFIARLMDHVDYLPDPQHPDAMVLVLEKRFPEAGAP